MTRSVVISIVLLFSTGLVLAGQGTINGHEAEGWDTGEYVVMVGVVENVQMERVEGEDRCTATMVPRSTLAGAFDPSTHPVLPVQFYVYGPTSSIRRPPEEGAIVMAVCQLVRAKERGESDRAKVYSHVCAFMPDEAALVVLTGFDDARIAQTLKKLQDARAHPDPNPYGKPNGEAAGKGR